MPSIAKQSISWERLVAILEREAAEHPLLMADRIAQQTEGDPFRLLVAIMLSARARDEVTEKVVAALFDRATTPQEILAIPEKELRSLLRPVGAFRQKTKHLRAACRMILHEYDGRVPNTLEDLVRLPGVGRKTANLTLIHAFDEVGISVDTHVHRLSNAFGIVDTKTPEQTERALRTVLPRQYWKDWNRLLVTWGKFICPRDANICITTLKKHL